jgi:DNA-binding HxlR family transcriptional regulator
MKGKRKSFEQDVCPIARSIDAIGDWWSLLIVRNALLGCRRFGEFHSSLGLAKNILAARLRKLVSRGIMKKVPAAGGTAYSEYHLTKVGEKLHVPIMALGQWGQDALFAPGERQSVVCDRRSGRPLPEIKLRDSDGRVLEAGDTVLRVGLESGVRSSERRGRKSQSNLP